MKRVKVTIASFVFLAAQMLLVPRIALGEIAPDFPLLLVAYFAINQTPLKGSISGFAVGLFQDLFNPQLLGLNALTKSLTGYAVSVMGAKADPENVFFLLPLFSVAALGHDFFYLLFFTGLDPAKFFVLLVTVSVPSALYTAVAGVVVHRIADFVGTRVVRTIGKARP
ncbi:MAG: rod shape-determining protein MreD [Candidatus Krumholzibacteriia bacterium]